MGVDRRGFLRLVAAAAVGAAGGVGAYGYGYERHHLVVTRATVPFSGLPAALAGLRVAILTDLHHSALVPADHIERAIALVLAERPDLIVLLGDYVTRGDRRYIRPVAQLLSKLHAPYGVFAVMGNHDDERDMAATLREQRIPVLLDARTELKIRQETLSLAGIRYWTRSVEEVAPVLQNASHPLILLAHDPRVLTVAAELDVPLVLSGHTHGGQVVLPLVGAPAAVRFPVVSGTAHEENTALYVSRGVGTVYVPVRFNCPPEINIVTLQKQGEL